MPGRVVVQWDKDDCADLGIIKVDLLGLGMMAVLEDALKLDPRARRRSARSRASAARTIQRLRHAAARRHDRRVSSRKPRADGDAAAHEAGSISTISWCKSRSFVPGRSSARWCIPICAVAGNDEPVTYPHPSLEPILERTLGVPLFQEQLLRIAMAVAGFSGGEAEELRRAMGFKRSDRRMAEIETRLRAGYGGERHRGRSRRRDRPSHYIVRALWIPRVARASFALIAYACAYLKAIIPPPSIARC